MTHKLSKLQIRAEILNAIKTVEACENRCAAFYNDVILPLQMIEDKQAVLEILIKELLSATDNSRFITLAFLTESIVPKEMIEERFWQLLATPDITDASKMQLVNILKDLGNQLNFEKYAEYFENPDSAIDADTEQMIQNAIFNPESLIDFLDFIEALPVNDKRLLLDSICEDYTGNEMANLFIPVLYANPDSELCLYAIKKLGASKSALAIRPLNFIIEYSKSQEIITAAKKSLSELKLAGAREDLTDVFYAKVFEDSRVDDSFVSMPDGHGNIGIIISRKRKNENSIRMFATVLNDSNGILDCFGFNDIKQSEFDSIVNKFYYNQEKICISAPVAKLILETAEKINLNGGGKIPYEYICWRNLLCDVNLPSASLNEVLTKKLEKQEITEQDLKKLYSTALFDKWFIDNNSNEGFDNLLKDILDNFDEKAIPQTNFETIETQMNLAHDKIWSQDNLQKLDFRLLLSAYLLYLNGFHSYANITYSIISTPKIKTLFTTDIIQKSIYEFLLRERSKHDNTKMSANIFSKRNEANKALLGKNFLDDIIKEVEEHWSN